MNDPSNATDLATADTAVLDSHAGPSVLAAPAPAPRPPRTKGARPKGSRPAMKAGPAKGAKPAGKAVVKVAGKAPAASKAKATQSKGTKTVAPTAKATKTVAPTPPSTGKPKTAKAPVPTVSPASQPSAGAAVTLVQTLRPLCQILRVLSDPTNMVIVAMTRDERSVGDISAALGRRQPDISNHLRNMRMVGLVRDRRAGKSVYYKADQEKIAGVIDGVIEALGMAGAATEFIDKAEKDRAESAARGDESVPVHPDVMARWREIAALSS